MTALMTATLMIIDENNPSISIKSSKTYNEAPSLRAQSNTQTRGVVSPITYKILQLMFQTKAEH